MDRETNRIVNLEISHPSKAAIWMIDRWTGKQTDKWINGWRVTDRIVYLEISVPSKAAI